jgi:small redox-active disulfide protein 2
MNCKTLERRTREAVEQLRLDATIQKVEDFQDIASYGVMSTPGLVIDEKVVSQGRVPTVQNIRELLQQSLQ